MSGIALSHVGKVYDDQTRAVTDLDLQIEDGEFVVFVGPSGCGKTTALRMIAGLESITEGEVRIGDRVVNQVPPRDRDLAMVFQSYALYPHLSVRDNIAFGLRLRKMPKAEITARVHEAAALLGLTDHLDRKPRNLSGGQRQRVAMGRAIVRKPAAFLMDEPLSNLDAKLRVQMRSEIAKLQRDLAVTTVYVTHDQTEAMTLGHRVAVIRKGVLQQIAPPQELYDRPDNLFVAGFIGSPAMNFVSAGVSRDDSGTLVVQIGRHTVVLPDETAAARPGLAAHLDAPLIVGIRPEDLDDARMTTGMTATTTGASSSSRSGAHDRSAATTVEAVVELVEPLGSDLMVHARIDAPPASGLDDIVELAEESGGLPTDQEGTRVVARFNPRSTVRIGDTVPISVATDRLHFFDASTGQAVWT